VASLSQGRTAAAQCGLFTYKSVPVIFEPPCSFCSRQLCILMAIAMLTSSLLWLCTIQLTKFRKLIILCITYQCQNPLQMVC